MKASNLLPTFDVSGTASTTPESKTHIRRLTPRLIGFLILIAIAAGSLYFSAGVSASKNSTPNREPAVISAVKTALPSGAANLSGAASVGTIAPMLMPPSGPPAVTTYASDCTTAKTVFNVQDTDK